MKYHFGKHVRANIGGTTTVGHVVEDAHDVPGADGPEQKYGVLGPDGNVHQMAYTKLGPDEAVPGGYFTDA